MVEYNPLSFCYASLSGTSYARCLTSREVAMRQSSDLSVPLPGDKADPKCEMEVG